MPEADLFEEANRQLIVCNACRYCEGYCPVFRAIETRRDFDKGDVLYLANLCHDCRACYYACMYTPPHEFAINIPQVMSQVRMESYRRWSWPGALAEAFSARRIGVVLGLVVAALVVLASILLIPSSRLFTTHTGAGAFYQIVPYSVMVAAGLALAGYAAVIWMRGGTQFWREAGGVLRQPGGFKALAGAVGAGLILRHLKGGGPGCNYPDELPSASRRVFHLLTYWGFLGTFISTTLAFIYQDFLSWLPPYPVSSAPVLFGSVGGAALIAGTGGLIWLKKKSDPVAAAEGAPALDYIFLVTLCLASLTGMLTLIFRATSAMGVLLIVHLAAVAALFITAPYGKFVHALYRTLALIRYQAEQSQPSAGAGH